MSVIYEGRKIMGYRRENGRVGVRNHVLILPLDDISNVDKKFKTEFLSKLEEEVTPTSFVNSLIQQVILSFSRQKDYVESYNPNKLAK